MASRKTVLNNSILKGAKKKVSCEEEWKQNIAKARRQSGQGYVSKFTGRNIQGKKFAQISNCCLEKCFQNFSYDCQRSLFNDFYDLKNKNTQDLFLAGCMCLGQASNKTKKTVGSVVERHNTWKYQLTFNGISKPVCRSFICNLYQFASPKRVRVLQDKILRKEPIEDKRGKHGNHKKIEPDVYSLALDHLKSIPNKPAHYSYVKSNRLYFQNPDLNIKKIFTLFQDYFKEHTGNNLQMKYKTYFKFFRETNFDFKVPKTDTCDFCQQCEVILEKNPNDVCRLDYSVHKKKADAYLKMKNEYLKTAKESDEVLVLEFDYAQNLALPKLTVTSQFYKRLLWLFLFCVHVHNDGSSFMYTFLESQCKKGANTVASFVFDCINKKIEDFPNIKKIVLLSDAAGGQNKNQTLLRFCSYLSKSYNVEVLQIFPVRGHSFGQCDRDFGVIRNALRKLENIEVPHVYIDRIAGSRTNPSPFVVVQDTSIVFDWNKGLIPFFEKTPKNKNIKFKIQQYSILKYKPCGTLLVSTMYSMLVQQPFMYAKCIPKDINLEPAKKVPLKPAKIRDIKDLFVFLKEESRNFYTTFFQENEQSEVGEERDTDISEQENVED